MIHMDGCYMPCILLYFMLYMHFYHVLCQKWQNKAVKSLTAQIFVWDLSFFDTRGSWSNVVNQTLNDISQPHVFENLEICDLEQAYDSLSNYEDNKWNASR